VDTRVLDWTALPEMSGDTVDLAAVYTPAADGRAGCR
jgi:hypothetical protein